MKLARAIHFDESDTRVYSNSARTGEWCVSGGFEFSNWSEADLDGKAKQAFSNGWFGLETSGRVTFVPVAKVTSQEVSHLEELLADHFVTYYGAPSKELAIPVASDELQAMADLCDEHDDNTLLVVSRELTEAGVKETFRIIDPEEAGLDQFAIHGSLDE